MRAALAVSCSEADGAVFPASRPYVICLAQRATCRFLRFITGGNA
jgi:hypothetical protein